MIARVLVLLPFLAVPAATVHAHAVGVSRGEYRAQGTRVRAELVFARTEVETAVPGFGPERLSEWIRGGVRVRVPAGPCDGRLERATPTEQDGVELAAVWDCPEPATAPSVRLDLLDDLSLGHRHLATATSTHETVRAVVYAAEPELTLAATGGAGRSLFGLGVEHILTGWDHVLFLVALVLAGGRLRSILALVTAFTLAHSVTLAVAALGIWTPHPTLVEPAIALSIAWVGIESLAVRDARGRWRLAFLFGLVHGFGFAGVLRELAVPARELSFALASFNVGVEAGQLAVLAIVLPFVTWLGRRPWFAAGGLRIASLGISAIGIVWFVVRVA